MIVASACFLRWKTDDLRQVEIGEEVTADDQKSVVEIFRRGLHRPGSAEVFQGGDVSDPHAEFAAITEETLDGHRLMIKEQDQLGNAVFFQEIDDMEHDRPVDQRDHRFRDIDRQGLDAGAESSRHNHCFHETSVTGKCPILFSSPEPGPLLILIPRNRNS